MKIESLQLTLKRDIRHERYNISQISAQLSVKLEEEDVYEDVVNATYEKLTIVIVSMEKEEVKNFTEKKNAIKN